MYVYQDGKLYAQEGDKLIGVEIHPDKVLRLKGTETKLSDSYEMLTPYEVQCKFQIVDGKSYIFPVEDNKDGEVLKDDPTGTTKGTARKSTRK